MDSGEGLVVFGAEYKSASVSALQLSLEPGLMPSRRRDEARADILLRRQTKRGYVGGARRCSLCCRVEGSTALAPSPLSLSWEPMGTDFWLQHRGDTIATMAFDYMAGEGRLAPRLVIAFECRVSRPFEQVEVHQLRSDVKFDHQLLGTATLREVVQLYEHASRLTMEAPISREALAYIDEHARTPDVQLTMDFRGYARATTKTLDPSGAGSSAIDWTQVALRSSEGTVRMPKSDWITRVVEVLGPTSHVLLDLPLPEPPDRERWKKSLDHLEQAERFYREGNDAEVLHRCYSAFEALEGAPTSIFDNVPDAAKRADLNAALRAFKKYLNAGRHVKEGVGEFAVDHRDSSFALSQVKLWLTYIARLLSDPK